MDINTVWARLAAVRRFSFKSVSSSVEESGWSGEGAGQVVVSQEGPAALLFNETGRWQSRQARSFRLSNTYRWTLDPASACIRLEHLRFGPDRPVVLFDLIEATETALVSKSAHLCGENCYSARLELEPDVIRLDWEVSGPKTHEAIAYRYG